MECISVRYEYENEKTFETLEEALKYAEDVTMDGGDATVWVDWVEYCWYAYGYQFFDWVEMYETKKELDSY